MLSPFFQPRCYSTVLNEKTINLLPFFLDVQYSITTVLQPQNLEFANFNFTVLSLIYHATIST